MTATRPVTAEELWRLPGDQRRELVQGEVRNMAPTGFEHGAVSVRVITLLAAHVESKRLGAVVSGETGFVLRRKPDTVRAADVAFIRADRIPTGRQARRFYEGAPDLAVEILSPTDRMEDLEEKIDDYLDAGCPVVWVVNPRRQTVTVYRPNQAPAMLRGTEVLEGYEVIPGFSCPVAELFV